MGISRSRPISFDRQQLFMEVAHADGHTTGGRYDVPPDSGFGIDRRCSPHTNRFRPDVNDRPAMIDACPLLEARRLGRREPNSENWLLRDICFAIHASDRLAIVGPTGSGKTLLLRALARLDCIDTGEVLWRGEPIRGDDVPRFRQQAIYLHQRPALTEGTVEDNLRFPFSLRVHQQREFRGEDVGSLLAQVNRDETFLNRSVRDLSGGEAQIVALLRAIQLRPIVLLLDEPTAALDVVATQLLETLVTNWFDDSPDDRAVVWVSHDEEQVGRVSDRVVNMSDGQIADDDAEGSEPSP